MSRIYFPIYDTFTHKYVFNRVDKKHLTVEGKKHGDSINAVIENRIVKGKLTLEGNEMYFTDYEIPTDTCHASDDDKIKVVLVQPLLKLDKLDWVVQKVTEIGIDKILLFKAEHSIPLNISEAKITRLNKIAKEACMQSGRIHIPSIEFIERKKHDNLVDIIRSVSKSNQNNDLSPTIVFADIDGNTNLSDICSKDNLSDSKNYIDIYITAGPEGGFSKNEIESLRRNNNSYALRLSNNVLRSETASICLSFKVINELTP